MLKITLFTDYNSALDPLLSHINISKALMPCYTAAADVSRQENSTVLKVTRHLKKFRILSRIDIHT